MLLVLETDYITFSKCYECQIQIILVTTVLQADEDIPKALVCFISSLNSVIVHCTANVRFITFRPSSDKCSIERREKRALPTTDEASLNYIQAKSFTSQPYFVVWIFIKAHWRQQARFRCELLSVFQRLYFSCVPAMDNNALLTTRSLR